MPAGPVDVHISRFTLEPGASVPSVPQPYSTLVYVETGGLTCPDNLGKLMYGPDGTVMYETTGGGRMAHLRPRDDVVRPGRDRGCGDQRGQ
jgi:hypothetical protein